MMNTAHLTSADFWSSDRHYVAASEKVDLSQLEGVGGCVIFQTSGSTGEGKWIVLEKKALLVSAKAVNEWLKVSKASRWGLALPINHVGGFSLFARSFVANCQLCIFENRWNAGDFADWVSEEKVTHVSLVPTQVHDLAMQELKAPSCLEVLVVGGGRLAEKTGQAARDLGWPVLASYGMTEAGSQVATQSLGSLEKPFAEGPLERLSIWEARVSENQLLELSGPALFLGTLRGGRFQERGCDWFVTSDRVKLDGRVIIPLGRVDSLVKVMGELVDLEAVEKRLFEVLANPSLSGSLAVIALPDARREHRLVAVFEEENQGAEVRKYNLQAKGFERIIECYSNVTLPRSSLGKLQRTRLVEAVMKLERNP